MVHADETGWREDGVNGYVWTFSTPTERYFLRRGRNKEVVDEALGDSFERGVGQRLLRRLPPLPWAEAAVLGPPAAGHPRPEGPLPPRPGTGPVGGGSPPHLPCRRGPSTIPRPGTAAGSNKGWNGSCWTFAAPTSRTRRRSRASCAGAWRSTSGSCLSSWREPDVPPDNNAAERSLRPLVQPQNQRRHPLGTGHRQQDGPGLPLRHLGRQGTGPSIGLPPVARFPSTLNCYRLACRIGHRHPRAFCPKPKERLESTT